MQRAADALVGTLREFINQPDYPTLVLGATDAAVALPNRTLYSFSQEDEDHYFLLFPNPAPNGAAYMDAIAQALVPQREALNAGLVARGAEPLPPWPLEVEDSRIPPAQRLRAAIEFCGQHLPQPDDIVWGLLPAEIGDMASYQALIAPVLCPGPVEPWLERHRFIVRDTDPNVIIPELYQAKNDRVLVMELDFSNESYERELHRTALNKALPTTTGCSPSFSWLASTSPSSATPTRSRNTVTASTITTPRATSRWPRSASRAQATPPFRVVSRSRR
jgi:hypothetical protein